MQFKLIVIGKKKREELNNIILNVKNDKKNQRKNKYTGLKS